MIWPTNEVAGKPATAFATTCGRLDALQSGNRIFHVKVPYRVRLLHFCTTLCFGRETVGENDAKLKQILGP